MKKKIYLVVLVLAVFLVAGFSCGDSEKAKTDEEATTVEEEGDSIIDDFKDALSSNQKMKCTYKTTDQGESFESTTYAEGDKYRTEYTTAGIDYVSIFDGKTMYSWDENTRKGTMMDIDCLEEFDEIAEDDTADTDDYEEYQSSEDILGSGVDVSCRKVSKIDLEVPSDVDFVDQCAAIKQQLEALENIQDQLPGLEGLEIPEL